MKICKFDGMDETDPICDREHCIYNPPCAEQPVVRTFESGANRDTADGKYDFEGFLSTFALGRFAQYMHKNRTLRDGSQRDSDNWQKGIPTTVYIKSMWRHFFDVWHLMRHGVPGGQDLEPLAEALCGLMFNVQGLLHEVLKRQGYAVKTHE